MHHCTGCTVRDACFVWCYTWRVRSRPSVFSLQMLYEVIIYVVWNAVGNMNLTNRRLLSISNAEGRFFCVDCSRIRLCATLCSGLMYLRLKIVLWCKIIVNTASYVLRDSTDRTNYIASYISKEIRAWMQLNRSPAVYDVIDKKITQISWMENAQIILNTENTLCLLYVSMLLFIICYLFVCFEFILV